MNWNDTVTNVFIRLGKSITRIIMSTDVPIAVAEYVIPNLDADEPGARPEIISGMGKPLGKLRATTISGYGPYASRGAGLKMLMEALKLSIIGLNIEMTTAMRTDMSLSHDLIISIVISNGGWYDKEFKDKCYCIYAFGYCTSIE